MGRKKLSSKTTRQRGNFNVVFVKSRHKGRINTIIVWKFVCSYQRNKNNFFPLRNSWSRWLCKPRKKVNNGRDRKKGKCAVSHLSLIQENPRWAKGVSIDHGIMVWVLKWGSFTQQMHLQHQALTVLNLSEQGTSPLNWICPQYDLKVHFKDANTPCKAMVWLLWKCIPNYNP